MKMSVKKVKLLNGKIADRIKVKGFLDGFTILVQKNGSLVDISHFNTGKHNTVIFDGSNLTSISAQQDGRGLALVFLGNGVELGRLGGFHTGNASNAINVLNEYIKGDIETKNIQ